MFDDQVSIAKRKLSNFILQPMLQTRIGSYCIILSIIFSAFIALIVYVNLGQMFKFIIGMTEAPEEVQAIILSYLIGIQMWIYGALGAYVVLVMAVSIWYTHRLVGPMVAFEKHLDALEQGNFTFRTYLRKNDAFHEVATVLNRVTETFGKKYGDKSKIL